MLACALARGQALALLSTYGATRYAIAYWWMRPPLVDGRLMRRMRQACVWLLLASVLASSLSGVQALVERHSHGAPTLAHQAAPALVVSLLVWCVALGAIPIPGARNRKMAQDNAGAMGWRLTAEEVAELEAASDAVGFEFSSGGFKLE